MFSKRSTILLLIAMLASGQAPAQTASAAWDGEWLAEGSLFQVRVKVEDGIVKLSEVESMGFVWTSEAGELDGDTALIPVHYAGVNGVIEVELLDTETAVARTASCLPEFMVVCTLAAGREALFKKVSAAAE